MNRKIVGDAPEDFYRTLIVAGFGGQGVLMIGNLLAYAAMLEGRRVSYLPVYGVEMRGGTANCTVVVSSHEIGSPIVARAQSILVMNQPSLMKYESRVETNGLLLVNSSLVDPKEITRKDIHIISIPVNDIARNNGNAKFANMVALGAYVERTRLVQIESLSRSLEKMLDKKYFSLIPSNIEAVKQGVDYVRSLSQTPLS
jgi:2-oxoglutarate ferredoxin oxidoreductase subunit gamma